MSAVPMGRGRRRDGGELQVGRVPPHNLAAEESLLGAMLLSRDAIAVASERLAPEDFYRPAHGHIFEAITALAGAGEPADPVTVAEELRRRGLVDAIGGPAVLVNLQAGTPATSNAGRYARIVEDHAVLRRMIGVGGEIAEAGYELPEDVDDAVDRAEAMVFALGERRRGGDTVRFVHQVLEDELDALEKRYERGDSLTGLGTGFVDLDALTSGLQPSALYVIGARPSMGKTALALNIVAHVGIELGLPVLVFSLEMSQGELTQRLLCSEARVDSKRVRDGRLAHADWAKIAAATGQLAEAPIAIDDDPNTSISQIRAKARRFKARHDLALVVVDYLQLMNGRVRAENRQVEVSEISRGLKILARELECPVIALSQLSRQLELRADKRPMLSDLRESGAVEQDADVVLFIYRDDVYNPESPDRGNAEIIVAKQRSGPQGTARLAWLGHYTRFANMAKGV